VLVARNGTETPIDHSAAPIINVRGEVSGVVLVFRDVTETRRAAELKERLAAVIESSDDIIVSKTLEGIIISWNRGAERVLGYTADEVIGRHVSMLMPRSISRTPNGFSVGSAGERRSTITRRSDAEKTVA
jgi:PAS domain-containing protein